METRPGINVVPAPQRPSEAVWPLVTLASGLALVTTITRKQSALRWIAASAGAVLAYRGVSMLVSGKRAVPTVQTLRRSIEVNAEPVALTAMWRNSGVLDAVMQPWGTVIADGANKLHWTVDIPVHAILSGEAYKAEEIPGELVHWRTSPESILQIDEWFRIGGATATGRQQVMLEYRIDYSRIPGGAMLESIAEFLHSAPEALILNTLKKLKGLAESRQTGEVSRSSPAVNEW